MRVGLGSGLGSGLRWHNYVSARACVARHMRAYDKRETSARGQQFAWGWAGDGLGWVGLGMGRVQCLHHFYTSIFCTASLFTVSQPLRHPAFAPCALLALYALPPQPLHHSPFSPYLSKACKIAVRKEIKANRPCKPAQRAGTRGAGANLTGMCEAGASLTGAWTYGTADF